MNGDLSRGDQYAPYHCFVGTLQNLDSGLYGLNLCSASMLVGMFFSLACAHGCYRKVDDAGSTSVEPLCLGFLCKTQFIVLLCCNFVVQMSL